MAAVRQGNLFQRKLAGGATAETVYVDIPGNAIAVAIAIDIDQAPAANTTAKSALNGVPVQTIVDASASGGTGGQVVLKGETKLEFLLTPHASLATTWRVEYSFLLSVDCVES